jgi:hypothetical protein
VHFLDKRVNFLGGFIISAKVIHVDEEKVKFNGGEKKLAKVYTVIKGKSTWAPGLAFSNFHKVVELKCDTNTSGVGNRHCSFLRGLPD